jgi:hypothetical protein
MARPKVVAIMCFVKKHSKNLKAMELLLWLRQREDVR